MNQETTPRQVPILFSTPMVNAIVEGRKTQTRRIMKPQPINDAEMGIVLPMEIGALAKITRQMRKKGYTDLYMTGALNGMMAGKPKCQPGDFLWVRETWRYTDFLGPDDENNGYIYKASENGREWEANDENWVWKPSIHMPKAAARIWLRCTKVTGERLHSITTKDIIAEGVQLLMYGDSVLYELGDANGTYALRQELEKTSGRTGEDLAFFTFWAELWIRINGRDSWKANPWVWVYEFEVVSTTGFANVLIKHMADVMGEVQKEIEATAAAFEKMGTACKKASEAIKKP